MDISNILGKDTKCLGFPMKCLITMLLIFYIISPLDFLPEMFLGPFGLIDDVGALLLAFMLNSKELMGKLGGIFK